MSTRASILVVSAGLAGSTLLAAITYAGPLDPPAGPIAPTYKTLAEVEPRIPVQSLTGDADSLIVINQPGSYYFTGDIQGVLNRYGIKVTADQVTIDLMGFSLVGVGSGQNQGGISVPGFVKNLTVKNGTIRNWNGGGSYVGGLSATYTTGARIENLHTFGNIGAIAVGAGSLVSDCVSESDGTGVYVGPQSVVTRCIVRNALYNGVSSETGPSTISDCIVENPGNTGILSGGGLVSRCIATGATYYGIHSNFVGGEIRDCVASSNDYNGIVVTGGCLVMGNTCRLNGAAITDGAGIRVDGADSRIEANNLLSNDRGINVTAAGNLIIRNSASGNATNYVIAASNVFGPVVTAANITTSSNPHSNYDF